MASVPEDLFDQAVKDWKDPLYLGRDNLTSHHPGSRSQLVDFQRSTAKALENASPNAGWHSGMPPFHVDYIDADDENACAFFVPGYACIGVTVRLIDKMADNFSQVSLSRGIAEFLGTAQTNERLNNLQGALLGVFLSFVFSHEYAHLVYGHASKVASARAIPAEFHVNKESGGSLLDQVFELHADRVATLLALENYLAGPGMSMMSLIEPPAHPEYADHRALLVIVTAIITFFLLFDDYPRNIAWVRTQAHPVQELRILNIMNHVVRWCDDRRPNIAGFMSPQMYTRLATLILEATGRSSLIFQERSAFWETEAAREYTHELDVEFAQYTDLLGVTVDEAS